MTTSIPDNLPGTTPAACERPPFGWCCTRRPGHEGPCAARPSGIIPMPDYLQDAYTRVTGLDLPSGSKVTKHSRFEHTIRRGELCGWRWRTEWTVTRRAIADLSNLHGWAPTLGAARRRVARERRRFDAANKAAAE